MDSPSAPAAPDPEKVSAAQGKYNEEAARLSAQLSRYDQITPYGSLNWSNDRQFDQTGYDKAVADWQAKQGTAAPATTVAPSQGEGVGEFGYVQPSNNGGEVVNTAQPNKEDFYTGGDKWSSKITLDPRVQSLVDSYLQTSQGLQGATQNALGAVNDTFAKPIDYNALPAAGSATGALTDAMAKFHNLNPTIAGAEGLAGQGQDLASKAASQWDASMKPLSYNGVDPLWKPNDQTRQQVIDSLYGQYTRQLNPRFGQEESKLRSDLMNRGLVEGSEAWKTQLDNFGREKNDAYNQAGTSSITNATDQMSALLRDSLAARQQGTTEAKDLWSAPQTQAANALDFSKGATGELGGLVSLQDSQINSGYGNASTAFNMQNTQRQDALTEEQQKRAQALQWLASLRTGSMPQMPDFQAPNGPGVQPPNYTGSASDAYNGLLKQYGADVGSNNQTMSSVAAIASALAMAMSDRRLKTNIKKIGELPSGQPWYSFDYLWGESREGVMADESPPEAVFTHPSGYQMVDYSKLGI